MKNIPTMSTGIIQTFGRYTSLRSPGLNFYIPLIQKLTLVSNRLCEKHCKLKVRTADKVFPELDITLQYRIRPEDTARAYFELADPIEQMISYTDNVVRKASSSLTLDELFESQSHIADAILESVGPKMQEAGFSIESAQIRNIEPPEEVMKSMNEINASERRKIAAQNDGEAVKIKAVLLAEADAKEKELRGRGIALMRNNITEGWAQSLVSMARETNCTPEQMLSFMLKVLQQETLETMSKQAGTKVIFVDKSIEKDEKQSFIQALEANKSQ